VTLPRRALAALVAAATAAPAGSAAPLSAGAAARPSASPGVANSAHADGIDIPKNILNFTHVDGGTKWATFLSLDLLFSTSRDPPNNSRSGAVEFYGLRRGDLSLNQVLHSQSFAAGRVLQDVSLQVGFDANIKDTEFARAKTLLVVGPDFHCNVPGGFLSAAIQFPRSGTTTGSPASRSASTRRWRSRWSGRCRSTSATTPRPSRG
jgi:hypothetical protein